MALLNWGSFRVKKSTVTTRKNLGCKVKQTGTKKGKTFTVDISKSTLWRLISAKFSLPPCLGKGKLTVVTNEITSGQGDGSSERYLHTQTIQHNV